MALLYYSLNFSIIPFKNWIFDGMGQKLVGDSISYEYCDPCMIKERNTPIDWKLTDYFVTFWLKNPLTFQFWCSIQLLHHVFSSPSKASFLKSKVPFFLCFKEFLMESSNKPFQIALFPPSSLWMYLFFWPTKCTKKKVDYTNLEKRVTF